MSADLIARLSAGEVGTAIAVSLGATGGVVALAGFIKSGFSGRRQRQRRDDAVWGYVDENGVTHEGIAQRADRHIRDNAIHVHPNAGAGRPR